MQSLLKRIIPILIVLTAAGVWLAAHSEKHTSVSFPDSQTIAEPQPEELGKVRWLRNMGEAQKQAVKEARPILILFQEVPGCATCRNYGNNILSHPLIVEAIETLFVPLAIYNNKDGEDAKVLRFFNEPAWNNPVVRIVNDEKKDLVQRVSGDYTPFGLVNAMLLSLNATNRVAPKYLELLGEELQAKVTGTQTATLGMYCFWTGEKELGKIPGVVSTEAGFMDGKEVVKVEYNPAVLQYEDLLQKAQNASCASHIFTEDNSQKHAAEKVAGKSSISSKSTFRADKEPKYYLFKSLWRYVPMTPLQVARANSLAGQGRSPAEVLSPRQLELATFIQKNQKLGWETAIEKDISQAWASAEKFWKKNG